MNKRSEMILLVFLLFPILAGAGEYGGEFLNIPVGPRAQGLGGAYGPVVGDASAVYWNPAGLAGIEKPEIIFCHAQLFEGLANHDFLSFGWPISDKLTVGLGWIRLGVDDIPRFSYSAGTPPQGSFGDNENAVLIMAASRRRIRLAGRNIDISGGAGFKIIYNKLDNRQATGLGADAGVQIKLALSELFGYRRHKQLILGVEPQIGKGSDWGQLGFSLAAQDLGGTNISWNTATQHQDIRSGVYKFGVAYLQPVRILRSELTLAWETANQDYQKDRAGIELKYRKSFMLRAGRDQGELVWGGGLAFWRLQLDYSFTPHELGSSHRVGCLFKI